MGTSSAMSTSNQYIKYKITINQNWQSVAENYSSVTVTVNFYRTNSGYSSYGNGTVYCKINGTTYTASVSTSQKITNSGIDLFSKTLNIYHNNDGTKTLTCSAWISHDVVSSSEQSYSQTLTTIPRTSSIASINGNTLGDPITVNINRASDAFLHRVFYKRTDGERFNVGNDVATSHTFTPSIDDCNLLPNSTSGTAEITVDTYYGSTYIGYNARNITVYVPSHIVPTIGDIYLTEAVSGIAEKFGGFVQWKSKINVSVNAWGAYSSSIRNYTSYINGGTYTSSSFTTGFLSGNGSCNTTVTDSRGRSVSKNVGYSTIEYYDPWLHTFSVSRCNEDGTANDSGNCAKIYARGGVAPVNNRNDQYYTVQYKKTTDTTYQTITLPHNDYYVDTTQIVTNIDTESEYEFILTIGDYFGALKVTRNISTAYTLVDYNASGRGIAFGKVSTKNAFEVDMQTNISSQILLGDNNNDENQVVFRNLAHNQGKTYENDGIYPHNTYICGGWGEDESALKIWDARNAYQPLYYIDGTKRLHYGDYGLYSPDGDGIFLDKWGNVNTQHAMGEGYWAVINNGVDYLKVRWEDKRLQGAIGDIHQLAGLYDNWNGTTGTITLYQDAANFTAVDIIGKTNDGDCISNRVFFPNGRKVTLTGVNGGTTFYFKNANITISGTTITFNRNWEMSATTGTTSCYSGDFIYITHVFGYK